MDERRSTCAHEIGVSLDARDAAAWWISSARPGATPEPSMT